MSSITKTIKYFICKRAADETKETIMLIIMPCIFFKLKLLSKNDTFMNWLLFWRIRPIFFFPFSSPPNICSIPNYYYLKLNTLKQYKLSFTWGKRVSLFKKELLFIIIHFIGIFNLFLPGAWKSISWSECKYIYQLGN